MVVKLVEVHSTSGSHIKKFLYFDERYSLTLNE